MNASASTSRCARTAGLTLVELLVVLFVLALLAQTAVLATEGLVDQGQRDATARSLAAFEEAVLGGPDRVDSTGRPLVRGFVADLGRLPARSASAEPGLFLDELWNRPAAVEPFGYRAPLGDPTVQVGCGWRGNYLRLGIGRTLFVDGWGRPFRCAKSDGAPPAAGDALAIVETLGANGAVGGDGNDEDLAVVVERTVAPLLAARWQGSVPVFVDTATGGDFVLRVYGPDGSTATTLEQVVAAAVPPGGTTVMVPDVSIGPRVLRVYAGPAPADENTPFPAAAARSPALPIVVEPGGIAAITVEMP